MSDLGARVFWSAGPVATARLHKFYQLRWGGGGGGGEEEDEEKEEQEEKKTRGGHISVSDLIHLVDLSVQLLRLHVLEH